MQSAIQVMLESIGGLHVVAITSSEMEATQWLHSNGAVWDIAILDLLLATGSGFNLIPRLREHNGEGHVVVASQFATQGVVERCLALGADAVFSKSDPSDFAEHLASVSARGSDHARRMRRERVATGEPTQAGDATALTNSYGPTGSRRDRGRS